MYLEFYNNNGSRSVRIVRASYEPNKNGIMTSKKKVVKFLGPVHKFDDGLPDFEKRMRQDFKDRKLKIEGFDYDEAERAFTKKKEEMIVITFPPSEYPTMDPYNIGYFLLDSIFEQLGLGDILRRYKSDSKIEYDLINIIKLYVYSRILRPDSKRGTVLFQESHPWLFFEHNFPDKNNWYRSLTVLNDLNMKIQKRMNTKIKNSNIGRTGETMFYDVTNCYFEIAYPDEPTYLADDKGNIVNDELGNPVVIDPGFRKKFKSKEERRLPLVQIGLMIDENAIPVLVRTFRGNTADPKTCEEILECEGEELVSGRFILVADKAMYSQSIFYKLVSKKNGYIVSKSVLKSSRDVKEWILEDKDWNTTYQEKGLNASIMEALNHSAEENTGNPPWENGEERDKKTASGKTVTQKPNEAECRDKTNQAAATFKYKSRIVDREASSVGADGETRDFIQYKVKQIVYWSESHYRKDVHDGEKLREELRQAKSNPNLLKEKDRRLWEYMTADIIDKKTGVLLRDAEVVIRILEDKLNEREQFYGFFMLETTEISLMDIVILGKYRGLSRIENSFRVCKSDLDIRPMFVSSEDHIKAHVLLCFIALTIMRVVQNKIMVYKGLPTNACAKWSFGLSEERIQLALNDYEVTKIYGPYYMINSMSKDQQLLNKVFSIPEAQPATETAIRNMRTAINKYRI